MASSQGKIYAKKRQQFKTLFISEDNHVEFELTRQEVYNAISGSDMLLKQGKIQPAALAQTRIYPRTAIALDKTETTLIIVVVDGKQPSYSEGVNLLELTKIIQRYGGDTALNLDGGGSSTLVIQNQDGQAQVLNSPSHHRIPGRERPVANHLGIRITLH